MFVDVDNQEGQGMTKKKLVGQTNKRGEPVKKRRGFFYTFLHVTLVVIFICFMFAAIGCSTVVHGTTQSFALANECKVRQGAITYVPTAGTVTVRRSVVPITIECPNGVQTVQPQFTEAYKAGLQHNIRITDRITGAAYFYPVQ